MIEKISNLDKQQYANIANFFIKWLEEHPFAEMDDDFHRTIRMSAMTYISLYENFLELYGYIVSKEYKTDTKKMH
jgi:hypothetical protein|tara:strand:+ start:11217 stop:11441 length:225 start_codon:yes stop_codon:yes gene_type:complete